MAVHCYWRRLSKRNRLKFFAWAGWQKSRLSCLKASLSSFFHWRFDLKLNCCSFCTPFLSSMITKNFKEFFVSNIHNFNKINLPLKNYWCSIWRSQNAEMNINNIHSEKCPVSIDLFPWNWIFLILTWENLFLSVEFSFFSLHESLFIRSSSRDRCTWTAEKILFESDFPDFSQEWEIIWEMWSLSQSANWDDKKRNLLCGSVYT